MPHIRITIRGWVEDDFDSTTTLPHMQDLAEGCPEMFGIDSDAEDTHVNVEIVE